MKKIAFFSLSLILLFPLNNIPGSNLFVTDKNGTNLLNSEAEIVNMNAVKQSKKKLGVITENKTTAFRLFAPSAEKVTLVLFNKAEDSDGKEYEMTKDANGVWETIQSGTFWGVFYNFKVKHAKQEPVLCLDPYAKAVASYCDYFGLRKGIIVKDDYNWGKDKWIKRDWRDAIVYEMHIKDMTAHPTSGVKNLGTYKGLTEKGKKGGISYIKNLGINTVELLPSQEFQNIEIPFKKELRGRLNTWNPYEQNYWGYMTAAFFAPESYFTTGKIEKGTWAGTDAKAVTEFKDMVKTFHSEGLAVVMDVVYNHVSEYEFGNLKEIDKEYYFRLDSAGNYRQESYCGNDFKTESPMARRMIVESILYWMKEYHIDGFRFDLGKLIDWETVEEVIKEAKKINPDVIIVCEPWGGGYDPAGFSVRGWGAWNDQIRNGIKGENPTNGLGWIFGKWYGNNNIDRVKSYVNGTLDKDKLGLFVKKEHSVNYLESHDGYTFGDFIRLGLGDKNQSGIIKDIDENAVLSPLQLKLNKLGAMFLLTSQGISMIAEGQEFARSKVLPQNIAVPDTEKGRIDHNTYNKDNEVNYINYKHADLNKDLLDYYKGLIELRAKYPAFRRADYKDIVFKEYKENEFALGYTVKYKNEEFFVIFNANPGLNLNAELPSGKWNLLVNADKAGVQPLLEKQSGKIIIPSSTGMVFIKIK